MSYHLGSVDPDERAAAYSAETDDAALPRRRSLLAGLAAVAVMGVFAGGLWFAYHEGRHSGTGGAVPLIRAAPGPTKIKPENPGGMQIPDRHMLIYRDERPRVERLLPPPEAPLPRPAPPPVPTAAPAPVAPAAPASPSQPTVAAPPSPAAPAPAKPEAAAGTRLQLGALRSQDLAAREWQRIKHADPDLVGKLQARFVRADLGARGVFWRIETQPVADPIAALQLCEALKKRDVGCVIAR